MPTINFRFDESDKAILKEEAANLGYASLSNYLVDLIQSRPAHKNLKNKPQDIVPVGKRGKRVETRVTSQEKIKLQQLCLSEGETESAVLLRQVRILINKEPHFVKKELKLLMNATSQLTAIGRNLNQIVAQINSGKIKDVNLSEKYILQIKQYTDSQAQAIRDLCQKSLDRVV